MANLERKSDNWDRPDFREALAAPLSLFLGFGLQVIFTGVRDFGSGQLGIWAGVVLIALYPILGYGRTSPIRAIGRWTFGKWAIAAVTIIASFYLFRFFLILLFG